MTKRRKAKYRHEHDWFPVAMNYEMSFVILECAESECPTGHAWSNLHFLNPREDQDAEEKR